MTPVMIRILEFHKNTYCYCIKLENYKQILFMKFKFMKFMNKITVNMSTLMVGVLSHMWLRFCK